jgi:hypothetical protein
VSNHRLLKKNQSRRPLRLASGGAGAPWQKCNHATCDFAAPVVGLHCETRIAGNDEEHLVTYLRLLDAHTEGADWREVARVVLHLDPEHESDRARISFDSHLSRAKWMTEHGYRHLLRGGASA